MGICSLAGELRGCFRRCFHSESFWRGKCTDHAEAWL